MNDGDADVGQLLGSPDTVLLLVPSDDDADDDACIDLLVRDEPEETNVLSVTVEQTPDERLSVWQQRLDDRRPRRATIVDASGGRPQSQAAGSDAFPEIELEPLPTEAELVDVATTVGRTLGTWESESEPSTLCLHSVSALLSAFPREEVISLVTALNDVSERTGTFAHHHLDPTVHSEETVELFRLLYDSVLEYDPEDGWTILGGENGRETEQIRPSGGHSKWEPDQPETIPIPYSFDQALNLISVPRRRTLLYDLKDRADEEIPLDDVVDQVVARERSIPIRESPASRDSVVVSLTHTHLPKLEELGILTYDSDERLVHYHGNPALESFVRYIETIELG